MEQARLRILLSTYGCGPGSGSEGGVGWNWALQIARSHEVWVLTQAKERPSITEALRNHPIPNLHVVYCELPRWAGFGKNEKGENLHYYLWQIAAYATARKLHKQIHFDLIHHVSLVRYWMPSFLALLPVPFVWGPVGGADPTPKQLLPSLNMRGRFSEAIRNCAVLLGELDPFVRLTARKAQIGLATTQLTKKRMEALGCRSVVLYSEVGLPPGDLDALMKPSRQKESNRFRVLSVGRLIPWKGYALSLEAVAVLLQTIPECEYCLVGTGAERQRLEELAATLGISSSIRFLGKLPRTEVFKQLANCDVFIHPSLHDSGGWACIEAMAAGCPIVCLDWAGPSVQVTEKTGIKVSPDTSEVLIRKLAAALQTLASCPVRRLQMGREGRQRVADAFHWDRKGEFISRVYDAVIAGGDSMPRGGDGVISPEMVAALAPITDSMREP
jgi:glycosyltransferase involved in cell wall biosynthesis